MIDLRSDTVTKPTAEMREAMAAAEVGDDVYAEDPTVNALQRRAAELLGKEAAIFVPSGTMGNQLAIACHTTRGSEVVCEARSHVFNYEMGAMAAISGVIPRPVVGRDSGRLSWEDVRAALRQQTSHFSGTGLVALENTHNMAGGSVLSPEAAREICANARERGLPTHLDGARIFNAAAASGRTASELAEPFDTVMFCLSKGLGAPVGSLLCGPAALVERAWIVRKMLGGGMRQVGVLAAAGLVALDTMVDRLAEDHEHAKRLARGLAALPRLRLDPEKVQTNIVIFHVDRDGGSAELAAGCLARKVKIHQIGPSAIRCVTHKDVDGEDIDRALDAFREITATW